MAHTTHSTQPISEKQIERKWHKIDVTGKTLGRIANEIARLLQGKHKSNYVDYLDCGDYIVVVNAKKIQVTGRKKDTKEYKFYSGYPGGLRTITYTNLMNKNPEKVLRHAISGMLPKNKLRDKRLARLFIFDDEHNKYESKFAKNEVINTEAATA